jgi:hypothetical protein
VEIVEFIVSMTVIHLLELAPKLVQLRMLMFRSFAVEVSNAVQVC